MNSLYLLRTVALREICLLGIALLMGMTAMVSFVAAQQESTPGKSPTQTGKTETDQPSSLRKIQLLNRKLTIERLENRIYTLAGTALLTINASDNRIENEEVENRAIENGAIDFNSSDAWVLFPNIRPSIVRDRYLKYFTVDGQKAELNKNVRVTAVATGACVIPHAKDFVALETFLKKNCRGDSLSHVVHKYYRSQELGTYNDHIVSFKLRHGYMATLAENEDGTGASQVFIAADDDLIIRTLPEPLRDKVSFIRVFPWHWTSKKGFGGSLNAAQQLDAQWRYDWGAGGQSTLDIEYVPMRHNLHWDSFDKINRLENATAVLGFNEPMQSDQAKMSIEQCLELWPKLMASGLRIGSLAPTDGSLDYLYKFLAEADQRGLRVDFVAVHCYHGKRTPRQWIDWLSNIHRRTGRPIWLTEFNNGADWVPNHNPSLEQNAQFIGELIEAMDNAPFIERYAIFNLGSPKFNRQIFKDDKVTPAGEVYRKHRSVVATQPTSDR